MVDWQIERFDRSCERREFSSSKPPLDEFVGGQWLAVIHLN